MQDIPPHFKKKKKRPVWRVMCPATQVASSSSSFVGFVSGLKVLKQTQQKNVLQSPFLDGQWQRDRAVTDHLFLWERGFGNRFTKDFCEALYALCRSISFSKRARVQGAQLPCRIRGVLENPFFSLLHAAAGGELENEIALCIMKMILTHPRGVWYSKNTHF